MQAPPKDEVNMRNKNYKKMVAHCTNRNTQEHTFVKGDGVLVAQKKLHQWTLPYEPMFYTITNTCGSTITARRISDGKTITRDSSKLKLAKNLMREQEELLEQHARQIQQDQKTNEEDWREQLLSEAMPEERLH